MRRGLYVIYDTTAQDIIGLVQLHKHDTVATRMFQDIYNMEGSSLAKHPDDYELVCIGTLSDDGLTIDPEQRVVITAKTLQTLQQQEVQH